MTHASILPPRRPRANCKHPENCVAGARGPCRACVDFSANAERMRERGREMMRKLNADPEFAAANAERGREMMRKLHADPEFAAAHAERGRERMRKLNAVPDFVPPDLAREYRQLRRECGEQMATQTIRMLLREP